MFNKDLEFKLLMLRNVLLQYDQNSSKDLFLYEYIKNTLKESYTEIKKWQVQLKAEEESTTDLKETPDLIS